MRIQKTKIALVTGATSGFGHGSVVGLLDKGFLVIATGRNLSQRPEVFESLRLKYPNNLIESDFEVTSALQRSQVVKKLEELGGLDVLVNNAGYGLFGPLEIATDEQIRHQMEVNFFAPTFLVRDALPLLRSSKGTVINISSVLGFSGFPLASLYCASKFALEGLTESLALELKIHGVDFALIQPGGYPTKFNSGTLWTGDDRRNLSIYKAQINSYKKLRDKFSSRPNGQDPNEVITAIVSIAEGKHRQFRSTLGKDASLTYFMRKLIPRNLFHTLYQKLMNKLLGL